MAEVDFSDFDSAEAWFETQSVETRCVMASRAALRVVANISVSEPPLKEKLALVSFWALLTSAGRGVCHPAEVDALEQAARSAASAALSALSAARSALSATARSALSAAARSADSAAAAADSTARSALSAASNSIARSASAVAFDADHVSEALFGKAVWAGAKIPDAIAENHKAFLTYLGSHPDWVFWRRWYEGMWKGSFTDWDLAIEVAKIPKDLWQGDDALAKVAKRIREIEAERAFQQTRINETLVFDKDTMRFSARTLDATNAERLRRHLSRVEDALDDIIALGGGNGLTANTVEFLIIKRLVRKYGDDPERAAFDLTDVNKSIRRQIKVGEYADDEPLRLLQAAVTACVSTICDLEPDVATELDREFKTDTTPLEKEEALLLEEAWRVSTEMLDAEAAQTTLEDQAEILTGQIIDAEFDAMPEWSLPASEYRAIVIRRQISRLWLQARAMKDIKKLAKHYDSDWSKSAGVYARYGGVAGLFIWAVNALGRLLGV